MKKITYIILIILCFSCEKDPENIKLSGIIFGTNYNIIYNGTEDYSEEINTLFDEVNQSLSTYIETSDISRINNNEDVTIDHHFEYVFNKSKEIYRFTEGAFDPTIGNVVNAWDFGAEKNKFLTDSITIKKLMRFVGLNRVGLKGGKLIKPKASYLEFNAIAKGYGIDVIADLLVSKGITDYLVDIGGDMRVGGINAESKRPWNVAIDDPNFDGTQSYSKVISLKNEALATSGTYRKFKVDENGNRYAHIINTKTGYPSKTNILSVSVIAPNCTLADGYATAFQAMGIEKVKKFIEKHSELKAYFIFENELGELKTLSLNNFPDKN